MEAMIFAAGMGTRMQHFTKNKPKALIEINKKPLIWHNINYLKKAGVTKIVVNTHHFAEQIKNYLKNNFWELDILISDETQKLLDTGGGLKKASKLFSKKNYILVINADIMTNLDIKKMLDKHKEKKNLATLAVRDRESSRKLIFDKSTNTLIGWKNLKTGEIIKHSNTDDNNDYTFAFSGLQIISPEIFNFMLKKNVFSIIELYLKICNTQKIGAFFSNDGYWFDVGSPEKLEKAKEKLCLQK